MPKGSQIFASLFDNIAPLPLAEKQRKGRNEVFNTKRNELICARYFYYGKFTDKRAAAVYTLLSAEFFLSERTIIDIITVEHATLRRLRTHQPALSLAYFKKEWPHLVW